MVELVGLVDAEDGAQDHLEGDRLHLVMDRKRSPERPAIDHLVGDVAHEAPVELHALAVERRRHQAPLADVRRAVEHQQRVAAEERLQELAVLLPGDELLGVGGEDLPVRVGMAEDDEAPSPQRADGEGVAVLAGAFFEEPIGSHRRAQHLHEPRRARSGRERARAVAGLVAAVAGDHSFRVRPLRRLDRERLTHELEGPRQEILPTRDAQQHRAAAAPPGAEQVSLPCEPVSFRADQRAGEDDDPRAAVARLAVGERQVRRFPGLVAAVAGDDVPEVVHVAQAVEEPSPVGVDVAGVAVGGRERCRDEAVGRELLGAHEVQVGTPETLLRHRRERVAVGKRREQRRACGEQRRPVGMGEELAVAAVGRRAFDRRDQLEHLLGTRRVGDERPQRPPRTPPLHRAGDRRRSGDPRRGRARPLRDFTGDARRHRRGTSFHCDAAKRPFPLDGVFPTIRAARRPLRRVDDFLRDC